MRYFPVRHRKQKAMPLRKYFSNSSIKMVGGFWAVELKHSQEFIGFTGLHAQPECFDFSPCVEIGWRLI